MSDWQEEVKDHPFMDQNDGNRYGIETSVQTALETLIARGIYHAKLINHPEIPGIIQVEEIMSPIEPPVVNYISNIEKYNEKECRAICKEIATCIQIMYEAGIAHRNLHIANIEIDSCVSTMLLVGVVDA
jgi:serine/threonine protein kinase